MILALDWLVGWLDRVDTSVYRGVWDLIHYLGVPSLCSSYSTFAVETVVYHDWNQHSESTFYECGYVHKSLAYLEIEEERIVDICKVHAVEAKGFAYVNAIPG